MTALRTAREVADEVWHCDEPDDDHFHEAGGIIEADRLSVFAAVREAAAEIVDKRAALAGEANRPTAAELRSAALLVRALSPSEVLK